MEAVSKKGFSLSASAVKRGGEQAAGAAAPKIPKVRETSEGRRFFILLAHALSPSPHFWTLRQDEEARDFPRAERVASAVECAGEHLRLQSHGFLWGCVAAVSGHEAVASAAGP